MEPVNVNPHGVDRDVMFVNQDTGEPNVHRLVVLDVIIINVTRRMEPAPVNPRRQGKDGKGRNVINVYKDTGELTVEGDVVTNVV